MNRKQFLILLALAVIAGGASLAVFLRNAASWQGAAGRSEKVLGTFPLNDVARVVIQNNDASLTVEKKADAWVVRERGDYPADFARVGGFIQSLWELKPVQEEKVGPSQLGRLDLLAPAKETPGTATLVDLQDKDGKRLAALLVGKKYLKKTPGFGEEEGTPAGRYAMPAGSANAHVSLVSDRLEQADPSPAAWLDKTFLRIDKIQSVAVTSGTIQWKLTRADAAANDWDLANLPAGEKLDPAKVPAVSGIFGAPSFTDVLPADAKRDGFDTTVTVGTFDGLVYTLKFGKADGDKLPVAVAVAAELPKERTPGKDEKTEDKKRLDDEFAARAKQLAETLAKAKALETRVYLVPKASYDMLWKPASDFLAVKEQPAPAAPVPAGIAAPVPAPAGK